MKRTILTMAIVIGCGISSPSFGFDLLDRMLGIKCGSSCDTAACDAAAEGEEPACGCEEPACGCEAPGGSEEPACGCEEPVCGCEPAAEGCDSPAAKKCGGLLSKMFPSMSGCDSSCDTGAEEDPACGCEPAGDGCEDACDSAPAPKCGGLLAKLFASCSDDACDAGDDSGEPACGCEEPACGCEEPACGVAAPVTSMRAAPIPAPVVDPSARVSTNRRVIQASAVYVR